MRLFTRNDTTLAIALIGAAVVIFQRPMAVLLTFASEAERQYHLDLLPGLAVLVMGLGFHEYRKREQAKAAAARATIEADAAHARARELERLVAFGQALGQPVDPAGLKQVLWRHLLPFAADRPVWILARDGHRWTPYLQDTRVAATRSAEDIERIAAQALAGTAMAPNLPGVAMEKDICFPLIINDTTIGVFGVLNTPPLEDGECQALGAAAALVAIAMRNTQLLVETRERSLRDGLTGCFSRTHGLETLLAELRRAKRTRHPLAIMMIDIDHFKGVNDEHGHVAGDLLLTTLGETLDRVLRMSDLKCRYGGDEFLIVLPETPLSGAVHAAESLLQEVAGASVSHNGHTIALTISIGITAVGVGEVDPKTLIARADGALYEAKRSGRNRYHVADARRERLHVVSASASAEPDSEERAGDARVPARVP